jgi:hypothetical protein
MMYVDNKCSWLIEDINYINAKLLMGMVFLIYIIFLV